MPPIDDRSTPRRGRLSAFQLLKAWLFDRKAGPHAPAETEFLNTRDGHELARFAQQAFGNDAAAKEAQRAAVDAEQAQIDALLRGAGAAATQPPAASSTARPARARSRGQQAASAPPVQPKAGTPDADDVLPRTPLELAVRQLEVLRAQGLSVETLAEALIVIETREVKKRAAADQT
ncbi:MAG TPA: hypothetical protein PKJ45_15175 [Rubrivivax sp.]|nr:hypothetical protein [Burkholderiales bacterium]HNU12683.1 hypothetical protein [Rubrivivax sp.]